MYEECSGRETEDVNEREMKGDLMMSERGKSGIDGRSEYPVGRKVYLPD